MADPLDALRQPTPPTPVAPRPAFAAALRARVEAALAGGGGPDLDTQNNDTPDHDTPDHETPDDETPDHDTHDRSTTVTTTTAPTSSPASTPRGAASITITPYICCRGAAAAIGFYERAFGAVETQRLQEPGGRIGHAEIRIGGAVVHLADEYPEHGIVGPSTLGGTSFTLTLNVPDCDQVFAQAVAAGATVVRPPADEFYGYRSCRLLDPFGHRWAVQTKLEDLSDAEMQQRFAQLDQ